MSECENNCCPGGRKTDKRGTAKKMSGGCRADGQEALVENVRSQITGEEEKMIYTGEEGGRHRKGAMHDNACSEIENSAGHFSAVDFAAKCRSSTDSSDSRNGMARESRQSEAMAGTACGGRRGERTE